MKLHEEPYSADLADVERMISAVQNNLTALWNEIFVTTAEQERARESIPFEFDGVPMRADGPLLSHHMFTFAAKLGFALHFETTGRPLPLEGRVKSMWFSNVQTYSTDIFQPLINALPNPQTLQQGKKQVSDQFLYSYLVTADGAKGAYYGWFNRSLAVAAFTCTSGFDDNPSGTDQRRIIAPGDFRSGRRLAQS
jgi:hypothetical protein